MKSFLILLTLNIFFETSISVYNLKSHLKLNRNLKLSSYKNSPNGEDTSLISILTIFEQLKGEKIKNSKISSDIDKLVLRLRDQFLKGFEKKYDVAKDTFHSLSTTLTNENDDFLSKESYLILQELNKQLDKIDTKAKDIIFYNEPLSKLEETALHFDYPVDAFDFFSNTSYRNSFFSVSNYSDIKPILMEDSSLTSSSFSSSSSINNGSELNANNKAGSVVPVIASERLAKTSFPTTTNSQADTKGSLGSPNNVDYILRKLELKRLEREKMNLDKFEREELAKIKSGLKVELEKWKNDIYKNVKLFDVAAIKIDLFNYHIKKVIESKIIDEAASLISENPNDILDTYSAISKARENLKVSYETIISSVEKYLIRPSSVVSGILNDNTVTTTTAAAAAAAGSMAKSSYLDRVLNHMKNTQYTNRKNSIDKILSANQTTKFPNFPILIHTSLILSMATYNLGLEIPKEVKNFFESTLMMDGNVIFGGSHFDEESISINKNRAASLACLAVGVNCYNESFSVNEMSVYSVRSAIACAILVHDKQENILNIAFRGTRDPVDVLTDLSVLSSEFSSRKIVIDPDPDPERASPSPSPSPSSSDAFVFSEGQQAKKLLVHAGFLLAFESLVKEINLLVDALPEGTRLLITGHSMGGALAQIAAAYYAYKLPVLVTFGSPAIGNSEFVRFLNQRVYPSGGLRVFNDFDAITYIAQLVGYKHAGISLRLTQKESAKDIFLNQSINDVVANSAGIKLIAPHILYQLGSLVYVFPVIGSNEFNDLGHDRSFFYG